MSEANHATDTGGKVQKLGDLDKNRRPGPASHNRLELEKIMGLLTGRGPRISTSTSARE